jgi:hypothetical protein
MAMAPENMVIVRELGHIILFLSLPIIMVRRMTNDTSEIQMSQM